MRRLAVSSLLALVFVSGLPEMSTPADAANRVQVVACRSSKRVCWPTGFAFTPDGTQLLYVERFTGQIRLRDLATNSDTRWAQIKVDGRSGEQGLLGIAVDPQWPSPATVFVYVTKGSPLRNRILRVTKLSDGRVIKNRILSIRAAEFHNGGTIHFHPDGTLWAVTGDAQKPRLAQRRNSRAGKVLRITESGAAAPGNPNGRRWWSRGHRNSFGFAFDPVTGTPWQTENGPECNDEINRIIRGRNYGWGARSQDCPRTNVSGPNIVKPRRRINPPIAPTGAAFCSSCNLGASTEGTLLVGSYNDRRIRRYTLTSDREQIAARSVVYVHGRAILAVESAPATGAFPGVYFSDRRGIYRLTP